MLDGCQTANGKNAIADIQVEHWHARPLQQTTRPLFGTPGNSGSNAARWHSFSNVGVGITPGVKGPPKELPPEQAHGCS